MSQYSQMFIQMHQMFTNYAIIATLLINDEYSNLISVVQLQISMKSDKITPTPKSPVRNTLCKHHSSKSTWQICTKSILLIAVTPLSVCVCVCLSFRELLLNYISQTRRSYTKACLCLISKKNIQQFLSNQCFCDKIIYIFAYFPLKRSGSRLLQNV